MIFSLSVEQWRGLVTEMLAADGHPERVNAVLAWMKIESGGNVCSTGLPGKEAGLVQSYHPDDDRYGMTFSELREGCSGQTLVTKLTDAQKRARVRQALNLIDAQVAYARTAIASVGGDWPEGSYDLWCLAKLRHALPGLYTFLGGYKHANGSAPSGWRVWRSWVEGLTVAEFTKVCAGCAPWSSSASRAKLFNNAEKVGSVGGVEVAGVLEAIAIPAVVAIGAHFAGKRRR